MNQVEILTERTKLRLIELADLVPIHELHSLPETDEYNTLGIPKDIVETKTIIEGWIAENEKEEIKNYTFAIQNNTDNAFLGLFGFKLWDKKYRRGEVWYKIHSKYWNKGIASEVLKAMIDFGFKKLDLHRIQAGCAVNNTGSIKVLEKVGMQREGIGREMLPLKSGWSDNYQYAILAGDPRV
ncbi:Protein N-acetyltransferase, RimJ/RimL family [Spirosomataceae bacterium TFI 002]|nr:Protein N-acetyltransferase, RimJ/RimL family [Spirosomataceae bacterium TFI 002]